MYEKETRNLLGVNLMGVRFRHEVCDNWILGKVSIDDVVRNLQKAYFDAEFTDSPIPGLIEAYNRENPDRPMTSGKTRRKILGIFG